METIMIGAALLHWCSGQHVSGIEKFTRNVLDGIIAPGHLEEEP